MSKPKGSKQVRTGYHERENISSRCVDCGEIVTRHRFYPKGQRPSQPLVGFKRCYRCTAEHFEAFAFLRRGNAA